MTTIEEYNKMQKLDMFLLNIKTVTSFNRGRDLVTVLKVSLINIISVYKNHQTVT